MTIGTITIGASQRVIGGELRDADDEDGERGQRERDHLRRA